MMNRFIPSAFASIVFIAGFFTFSAEADEKGEKLFLKDGRPVIGFYAGDLPKELRKDHCGQHIFTSVNPFKALADGRYESRENDIFMVEGGCLFPITGRSKLKDGREVEFYQEYVFSEWGEAVFYRHKEKYIRLPDGSYELENGEKFEVSNGGRISEYGGFHDGRIVYEDRN